MFLRCQGSLEQELDRTIMLEEESLGSGEENWVYKMIIFLCVVRCLLLVVMMVALVFFFFPLREKALMKDLHLFLCNLNE